MNFEQLNDLAVWRRMPTLDLDRIAAVRLMNRVDTKYLVDERRCMELLELAADQYYVQIIDDCRACRYATLYYDTPQWDMYHMHHNRRLTRQKIRTRTYVETGVTYLEVKNKSNKGRTHKRRMALDRSLFAAAATDTAAADFLRREARYAPETLSPSLATRFVRVTLVNHAMTERLTIDFDLHFDNVRAAGGGNKDMNSCGDMNTIGPGDMDINGCGNNGMTGMDNGFRPAAEASHGHTASLGRLVVIELKQDALAPSPMKQILAQLRVKPFKLSKYCIGEALTNPLVKHNRFKAKIRAIGKMAAHDSNINDML
ncbi:MAG: polyphosphate polymerase domain-containing protein [Bacteroidales bacterium]|nr:MAG: polyphosphate polymerase domain-containing protein [Bacteroidales bacterium]